MQAIWRLYSSPSIDIHQARARAQPSHLMHSDKHPSSKHHPGKHRAEKSLESVHHGGPPSSLPGDEDATGSAAEGMGLGSVADPGDRVGAGGVAAAGAIGGPAAGDPTGVQADGQAVSTAELEEQRDKYLRLAAEYDNYRRRTLRERTEAGSRGQADLVKLLVDPLDDLARFAHIDPASTDAGAIVQGVELVERKMMKALAAAGLQVINPINQVFDPALHEAVATERALSPEDDHLVARVYQPGYLFNGQLLRPARVVVNQWNG
jgi:molecular chaperone GrpE